LRPLLAAGRPGTMPTPVCPLVHIKENQNTASTCLQSAQSSTKIRCRWKSSTHYPNLLQFRQSSPTSKKPSGWLSGVPWVRPVRLCLPLFTGRVGLQSMYAIDVINRVCQKTMALCFLSVDVIIVWYRRPHYIFESSARVVQHQWHSTNLDQFVCDRMVAVCHALGISVFVRQHRVRHTAEAQSLGHCCSYCIQLISHHWSRNTVFTVFCMPTTPRCMGGVSHTTLSHCKIACHNA